VIRKLIIPLFVTLIASLLFPGVQAAYAHEEHIHAHAAIDIKPGSDPNAVNIKNRGLIPVALLGSAIFEVENVDVSSVQFGSMCPHMHDEVRVAHPLGYAFEDVNSDGYVDLLFQFDTQSVGLQPGDTEAHLHGALTDGSHFCGHDTVKVIG